MYLTYNKYLELGGKSAETEFVNFVQQEKRAEAILNFHTERRLVDEVVIPPEVELVMFELINLLQRKDSYEGLSDEKNVSSVSNDGVSISFSTQDSKDFLDNFEKSARSIIIEYLYGLTNSKGESLIYRGW